MATVFKRISKVLVKPHEETESPVSAESTTSLELLGIDVLTNHMHVKSVYFFPATLNPNALKEALAKVMAQNPLLGGRVRSKGKRMFVDWSSQLGALVYEQRALVYGGEDEGSIVEAMKKHGNSFARGPINHAVDDDRAALLILTLTELNYRENASPWSCRPAACSPQVPADSGFPTATPIDQMPEDLVARYAVGVALSHDIADGCSIAQFLTALARASMNMSVPTPAIDRSLLLSAIRPSSPSPEAEEPKKPTGEMYPGYRAVSFLDRLTLVGAMMMSSSTSFIRMSFSRPELEAIKAAAMAPLEGTDDWVSSSNALAAHLWPIITELMVGPEAATLLPYATAINHRKHLGLPGHYFGNCATFRQAEPATADEGLTSLALKIRRASRSSDGIGEELSWMQQVYEHGKLPRVMSEFILDSFRGKPAFSWDDVSNFVPADVPGVILCKVPSIRIDLPMFPVPGIALVLPNVNVDGTIGKDVCIAMSRAAVNAALSPEYQARIHAYAPGNGKQSVDQAVDSSQ